MKLNKRSREKGITLISLVITIIVLLILSGVTIAALSGGDSSLQKASEASEKDALASAKEDVTLKVARELKKYYESEYVTLKSITEEAENQGTLLDRLSVAAANAVNEAKSSNKKLLDESGVSGNTILLKTTTYSVTGTIGDDGVITWDD